MWSLVLPNTCHHLYAQSLRNFGSSKAHPIKMSYKVFGQNNDANNTPLIIMHGLFGSKRNWRSVGSILAPILKTRIYTVDARNHGESPHTKEHTIELIADDLALFLKDHGLQKTNVMGHCMGGRPMMFFALKYPQLMERGVIVDVSPVASPSNAGGMEEVFTTMKRLSIAADLSLPAGRKFAAQHLVGAVHSPQTLEFILFNLRKQPTGGFYWLFNLNTLHESQYAYPDITQLAKALPPFTGPMMFICGKNSTFVDPKSWPDIQTVFPNANIHWLDAGHLVYFDQPRQFIDLVHNFLKKVVPN